MTEYIRENGLLPSHKIDRIIAATPTQPLTSADFERLGYTNWEDWLESICNTLLDCCSENQLLLEIGMTTAGLSCWPPKLKASSPRSLPLRFSR